MLPHGTRPVIFDSASIVADGISITLSRSQVNQVLRQASHEPGVAGALSGLTDHARLARVYRSMDNDGPQLSRSLLIGLIVLCCFPEDGSTLGINELAGILGLGTSTAFRYIATLVAAGLLERDPKTRRYFRATVKPSGRGGHAPPPPRARSQATATASKRSVTPSGLLVG